MSSGADGDRRRPRRGGGRSGRAGRRARRGRAGPGRASRSRCTSWTGTCCRCRRRRSRRASASSARGSSAAPRRAACRWTSRRGCPRARSSSRAVAKLSRVGDRVGRAHATRSQLGGMKSSPMPSTTQRAGLDRARRSLISGARIEPAGSASTISACGATRAKKRPRPVSVPPEPTPTTTASSSCVHLLPDLRAGGGLVRQRIGGVGELVDVEGAGHLARRAARPCPGSTRDGPCRRRSA